MSWVTVSVKPEDASTLLDTTQCWTASTLRKYTSCVGQMSKLRVLNVSSQFTKAQAFSNDSR